MKTNKLTVYVKLGKETESMKKWTETVQSRQSLAKWGVPWRWTTVSALCSDEASAAVQTPVGTVSPSSADTASILSSSTGDPSSEKS